MIEVGTNDGYLWQKIHGDSSRLQTDWTM